MIAVSIASTGIATLLAGVLPGLRLSRVTLQADMARAGQTGLRTDPLAGARARDDAAGALPPAGNSGRPSASNENGPPRRHRPGFRAEHVVVLNVRDETPGSSFGDVDSARTKDTARHALSDDRRTCECPPWRPRGEHLLVGIVQHQRSLAALDQRRSEHGSCAQPDRLRLLAILRDDGHGDPAGPRLHRSRWRRDRNTLG